MRAGELGLPTVNGYAYYYYSRAAMMRLLRLSPAAMRAVYTGDVAGKLGGIRGWREHSHPATSTPSPAGSTATSTTSPPTACSPGRGSCSTPPRCTTPRSSRSSRSRQPRDHVQRVLRPAGASRRRPAGGRRSCSGSTACPIRAEKSLHDLATWTQDHPALARALSRESSRAVLDRLGDGPPPTGVDPERVGAVAGAVRRAHLDPYGHTVYNLDFVNPVPADDPAPLLDTLRFYLRGEGGDPHERQARLVERREAATAAVRGRLDPAPARRVRPAAAPGRRTPRRCARTPWPTSAWPGRRCAGCCWSWAAGSPPPARWAPRPTCSGCATTSWHPWPRRGTAGNGR